MENKKELKNLRPYALYVKMACDQVGMKFDEHIVCRSYDYLLYEQRKIIISVEENPFGKISLSMGSNTILLDTLNQLLQVIMEDEV